MARVTATEVKAIMDTTTLTDPVIETFIGAATAMIDANLSGKGLSDDVLKEVERWLSAHFIVSTMERVARKEGAGGAYIEYAGEWGMNLSSTSYGQTAMMLDSSGTLAALGNKAVKILAVKSFE